MTNLMRPNGTVNYFYGNIHYMFFRTGHDAWHAGTPWSPTGPAHLDSKYVLRYTSETWIAAPPRTIRDITAILDEQKLVDPGAAAKARAEATSEPHSGLDGLATASRIVAQIRFSGRQ